MQSVFGCQQRALQTKASWVLCIWETLHPLSTPSEYYNRKYWLHIDGFVQKPYQDEEQMTNSWKDLFMLPQATAGWHITYSAVSERCIHPFIHILYKYIKFLYCCQNILCLKPFKKQILWNWNWKFSLPFANSTNLLSVKQEDRQIHSVT